MSGSPRCRPASGADVDAVRRLVAGEGLPTDGVDESLMPGTSLLVRGDAVLGCAAVEVHGRTGLLRSVVVAPGERGRDLGRLLVRDRIGWAREHRLETLVLFTETAAGFFGGLGFRSVPREELPAEIHGCFEFGFCPSTSTSMQLDLRSGASPPRDAGYR